MPPEDIARRLRRRPFEPFRLCMTDGVAFEVRHPELLLLGKRSAIIGLPGSPEETIYERAVDLDLVHVLRLEPRDLPTPPDGQS